MPTAACRLPPASQLHFVRCFKPNDKKAADVWDESTVSRQLHTSGVLDALRVARTGYPDRMPFGEFASYFGDIAGIKRGDSRPTKDIALEIMKNMEITPKQYKVGRERVFLSLGVLDDLKAKRTARMAKVVIKLQCAARGMSARRKARSIREARMVSQKAMEAAMAGDDIPALQAAISAAVQAGVGLAPKGAASLKAANEKLAELKRLEAERAAATAALEKAMSGFDMGALAAALAAAAKVPGIDMGVVEKAKARHAKMVEEERLKKEEEARLAQVAAAEKAAAEATLAAERAARQAQEEARRKAELEAEEAAKVNAKKAEAAAAEAAKENAKKAQAAEEQKRLQDAEDAEQRAIEEEENLRNATLEEVQKRQIAFKSEPSDVLECTSSARTAPRISKGASWLPPFYLIAG